MVCCSLAAPSASPAARAAAVLGLAWVLAAPACRDPGPFRCGTSESCGVEGVCEPTGYCSFPDVTCATSWRYGAHAAEGLAGTCVPARELPDARAADGAAPDATAAPPDADLDAGPPATWWDPAYTRRWRIAIENAGEAPAPPGHPVAVAVDLEAVLQGAALDTVRVVHAPSAGPAELPRVLDVHPYDPARIWFGLAAGLAGGASARNYWLYAGGPEVPAPPDPSGLFELFAVLDAPHEAVQGEVILGGEARVAPGARIYTVVPYRWGVGYALDVAVRLPQWGGTGLEVGFGIPGDATVGGWMSDAVGFNWRPYYIGLGGNLLGDATATDLQRHILTTERREGSWVFALDGVVKATHPVAAARGDALLQVDNNGTEPVFVPWVRVRPVAAQPPVVTLGPLETW